MVKDVQVSCSLNVLRILILLDTSYTQAHFGLQLQKFAKKHYCVIVPVDAGSITTFHLQNKYTQQ